MEEADDPHPGHKLCGYLSTILTIPSLQGPTIPPFSPCHIIADKHNVGFETQDGIILCPISNPRQQGESSQNGDVPSSGGRSSRKRRFTGIGIVNGSLSVVHQIHALVMNKCIKVTACVLHVEAGDCEVRVVVMVDVYLPVELWSGWQFPKLGSVAGAFFKHLSCNWEERRATLGGSHWYPENVGEGNRGIWTSPDCHVYGCKAHHSVQDSSRTKDFELHEIFKNLPGFAHKLKSNSSRLQQAESSSESGIWDITDDILINILSALGPKDLVNVNKTCRHLRNLVASVVPCMKLKLFPHQQAAVEWMLQRERNPQVLRHPLYMDFATEDGLVFYIDVVTGEFVTGLAPTVRDFCGGMFCDEPGLGKTVTALSLILKTQGTIANPPELTEVIWCNVAQNCGYYELSSDKLAHDSTVLGKRIASPSSSSGQLSCDQTTPISNKRMRFRAVRTQVGPKTRARNLSCKKNLLTVYGGPSGSVVTTKKRKSGKDYSVDNETWVQCDACLKWRRLDQAITVVTGAWFCSMNSDPKHRSCRDPEEDWDKCESVTHLPGFFTKGTRGKKEHNVSFFVGVLKEHSQLMSSYTRKALTWLADLSENELRAMETVGLPGPLVGVGSVNGVGDSYGYHKIFQAFGFLKCIEKGVCKWYYPRTLDNLEFDLAALNVAMHKPLDSIRFYLSRATLIIVPANLVDHWTTQIQKHVKSDQLRVCIWTDLKKPSAHSLAWDYDIVITTFNRLSAEWSASKKSPLMQVHWFRVLLDEGHTLGSSLSLTNKLHMAISLRASSRWLLTGTPTPNTPDSQLSHLHPMLHFLHEECYGLNQKSWEAGILKPFEAEMEEGRTRLLQLLHRCLISAKKVDMKIIPPCIKKITFLNFSKEHARSYNELVVTVRRNILMADWNDPSHIESLLNPKQWKFRSSTIRNVRLSCCVAGNIKLSVIDEDIQETMEILHEKGLDPTWNEYSFIKYCLEFGGKCFRCNEWCRLPIITPCWHLLCLECVSLNSEKCTFPGCGKLYEMQAPEILTRPENPNPKWPVPKDLIELQPSYKQDDWNPDWEFTSSSKVAYLVERLKALKVSDRDHGYFVLEHDNEKINEQLGPTHISNETVSNKVIIFSQFLEHIHIIEKQLHFAGINYASLHSPMHSFKKMKALNEFQLDDNCMALIMDGSAALGLDFSFVSHVFLMEPIWDRSMEEQVISRAHRMGATRPIHVETLAMRGTIEEQMLKFLEDPDQCRRILTESKDEGGRAHRSLHDFAEANYLAHLSFVHESSST